MGAVPGALIGGALGIAESFFDNPSTKELEKDRWGGLADKGIQDAQSAYLANHPVGDTSIYQEGPRKGEKWKFENALEDTKKDPSHFRLVFGNYDTFGNDWSTYSSDQQDQIVSRLANEGLYAGRKGDVVITDKNRARQIKDDVLSGSGATAVTPEVAKQTQGVTQMPGLNPVPQQIQGNDNMKSKMLMTKPTDQIMRPGMQPYRTSQDNVNPGNPALTYGQFMRPIPVGAPAQAMPMQQPNAFQQPYGVEQPPMQQVDANGQPVQMVTQPLNMQNAKELAPQGPLSKKERWWVEHGFNGQGPDGIANQRAADLNARAVGQEIARQMNAKNKKK